MSVTTDLVATWRRPRAILRQHLARGRSEPFALSFLLIFLLLAFVGQWPVASREAFLAGEPSASPRLSEAVRRESWSERLTAVIELDGPGAVDGEIARLFAAANAQVASALQVAQGASHADTTRSPSAAAPSGNGPDDVGELRKRVESLEARLAELEARLRGS